MPAVLRAIVALAAAALPTCASGDCTDDDSCLEAPGNEVELMNVELMQLRLRRAGNAADAADARHVLVGVGGCVDMSDRCQHWVSMGECARNPSYMNTNCKLSCGNCQAEGAQAEGACVDTDSNCAPWAKAGECDRNSAWMHANCARSCRSCALPTAAPTVAPTVAPTAAPTAATTPCADENDGRQGWAHDGWCTKNPWMPQHCQKSCGVCESGGEAPTEAPPSEEGCSDGHAECAGWAASGECEKNPQWMKAECQKSCHVCSNSDVVRNPDVVEMPRLHGMAYGPSPMLTVGTLPNDDFMMDGAELLWGETGRHDLAVMHGLGVNGVRLYGNDPQWNHKNFFDEAVKQDMHVIVGMSDWPYTQMNTPPNCLMTDYLCYDQLYESYKANLETGGFLTEDKGYHPAILAVIVINEPELKVGNTGADTIDSPVNLGKRCKLLASAWDGMLQAEQDVGVTGRLARFTITWSFAKFLHPSKAPALGQMEYFWECVQNPQRYGYTPKNDLKAAFLQRWVNGFNTQNWASSLKGLIFEPYKKSVFPSLNIPVFIGEYHSINNEAGDLKKDLQELDGFQSSLFPFFKGFAFFELTRRYDKGHAGNQDMFGMFQFGEREIVKMVYFGENYSVRCLEPVLDLSGKKTMESFQELFASEAEDKSALNNALC